MARFYAVKQGRIPGVYSNWSDCEAQVKGYRGALYKSFNNEEDAKKYVGAPEGKEIIVSAEDHEAIKWELEGIREGLTERDIVFILGKVNMIADILKINLAEDNIADYKIKK